MIKCNNAWTVKMSKSPKVIRENMDKKLLNKKCKCCACVCVYVWECGNNIVLFFGCANKINPLYFYYPFILVVICNSYILYVSHPGLKITIFLYKHSIKAFIHSCVVHVLFNFHYISCYVSNYLVKIYCSFILYHKSSHYPSNYFSIFNPG